MSEIDNIQEMPIKRGRGRPKGSGKKKDDATPKEPKTPGKRGRKPGSKNKPKMTDGNKDTHYTVTCNLCDTFWLSPVVNVKNGIRSCKIKDVDIADNSKICECFGLCNYFYCVGEGTRISPYVCKMRMKNGKCPQENNPCRSGLILKQIEEEKIDNADNNKIIGTLHYSDLM